MLTHTHSPTHPLTHSLSMQPFQDNLLHANTLQPSVDRWELLIQSIPASNYRSPQLTIIKLGVVTFQNCSNYRVWYSDRVQGAFSFALGWSLAGRGEERILSDGRHRPSPSDLSHPLRFTWPGRVVAGSYRTGWMRDTRNGQRDWSSRIPCSIHTGSVRVRKPVHTTTFNNIRYITKPCNAFKLLKDGDKLQINKHINFNEIS